ncbi:Signal peptidase I W [Actinomyces bovis]|uniref:Signal peptidase I n=1 Tax=Actinomyces bovis TaxID=1658 RepID=A0ABY1VLA8_9ACTO|nr:signal peptidase I [Actinomyces bovis]SPT52889.1 Signal peptidase I W [Actinomyces bovis]VEG55020.1 Signal peptidase I W [Actinomyces israelii]
MPASAGDEENLLPYYWSGPRLSESAPKQRLRSAARWSGVGSPRRYQVTRANRRHEAPVHRDALHGTATSLRPAPAPGKAAASSAPAPRSLATHATEGPQWRKVVPLPGRPEPRRRLPRPKPTGPLALLVSTIEILLGLTVIAVIGAVSLVPAFMGWVPLTVLTGSMSPGIPPGSLIAVRSVSLEEASHLPLGTVVTYLPEAGSDVLITHRIVGLQAAEDGTSNYRIQGDANGAPDPGWIKPKQIRGILRYHLPFLGRVLVFLDPSAKAAWRTVAAGGLGLYALWEGAGILVERRRLRRREQRSVAGTTA